MTERQLETIESAKDSFRLVCVQVADGIYQHVDVREEGKENAFSLGHTLWINNEVRRLIISQCSPLCGD